MRENITLRHDTGNNQWQLFQEDDRWKWEKLGKDGKMVLESVHSFETFEECESDAKEQGLDGFYISPPGRGHKNETE